MSTGTLLLGLYLVVTAAGDLVVFGWFIAALGLMGVLAPVVLAREPRRDR